MEKIADFCDRWQVVEFSLFGSILRDDFRPDSDVDVMVQFAPDAHPTFATSILSAHWNSLAPEKYDW